MTQLIDTIDSKKLYADRALKDANGKQIDTTYAEAPVILTYGQTVTETKERLTELFKQGRLYVLYDGTSLLPCTATYAGYVKFWFTEATAGTTAYMTRIEFNVNSSSWSTMTDDLTKVKTRTSNGVTGYLGEVLKAGQNISTDFDSKGNLVISAATQRMGLMVDEQPFVSITEIFNHFYSDATYAFDLTHKPVRTFAQVKAYPAESKVVYGRIDGTTRQEYTLTYANGTYTWTHEEYELQTKLTFDSTPTADSTNPVKSGGIKTAIDGKMDKQTVGSESVPVYLENGIAKEAIGVATKAELEAAGNVVLTYNQTPTQTFDQLVTLAERGYLYCQYDTHMFTLDTATDNYISFNKVIDEDLRYVTLTRDLMWSTGVNRSFATIEQLNTKQDKLTAGSNILINNDNVISTISDGSKLDSNGSNATAVCLGKLLDTAITSEQVSDAYQVSLLSKIDTVPYYITMLQMFNYIYGKLNIDDTPSLIWRCLYSYSAFDICCIRVCQFQHYANISDSRCVSNQV